MWRCHKGTQSITWVHKLCKYFCFRCSLILKLHCANWLTDICIYRDCMKYVMCDYARNRVLHQISLSTSYWKRTNTFIFIEDLRFDLKDLGFEEKWRFEIWLNDLNTFLERFEIWVRDTMWDFLPITAYQFHIVSYEMTLLLGWQEGHQACKKPAPILPQRSGTREGRKLRRQPANWSSIS